MSERKRKQRSMKRRLAVSAGIIEIKLTNCSTILATFVLILLSGCGTTPTLQEPVKLDITQEPWYGPTVDQVKNINKEAEALVKTGKADEAAARITEGQPLVGRLLAAPQPTLAAMEAASDLDHLYATMLLSNRHYGWARLFFQKNQTRWSSWKPQTQDTERRRKQAELGIVECDRGIEK